MTERAPEAVSVTTVLGTGGVHVADLITEYAEDGTERRTFVAAEGEQR